MSINVIHAVLIIAVAAGCTILLRALPFLVFGGNKGVPATIQYLGDYLPAAIMVTLVVYCLKSVNFFEGNHGLPEIISVTLVVILHFWRRNVILSVGLGTICYMLLIRFSFLW